MGRMGAAGLLLLLLCGMVLAMLGAGGCGSGSEAGEVRVLEAEELWPGGAPGPGLVEGEEKGDWEGRRWNVRAPTVQAYLPAAGAGTGQAVVVFPGGAYQTVAMKKEGDAVGRWLAGQGVAAFVVKYRVRPFGWPWALVDGQEAVRLVRARAGEYGVEAGQVGVCGFSAGGHLAATVTVHEEVELGEWVDRQRAETRGVSCRPDFSILVYPVITMEAGVGHGGSRENLLGQEAGEEVVAEASNERWVRAGMGPVFLVHATDDRTVVVENALRFYESCVEGGVSAEMHLFAEGGHGFGLGQGRAAGAWRGLCEEWLANLK